MRSSQRLSRRNLLHYCLGLSIWPLNVWSRLAAASLPEDPVAGMLKGFSRTGTVQRRYRVDATVLFCGLPLITKRNVGGGHASIEIGVRDGARALALQFAAGSWPEHTGGLNRFGVLREVVVERDNALISSAFAGLITHSPEKNFEEARRTFVQGAPHPLEAIVAVGETKGNSLYGSTRIVPLPNRCQWTRASEELLIAARGVAGAAQPLAPASIPPFLYAMHRSGLDRSPRTRQQFLHNGKAYFLELRRNPRDAAESFGEITNAAGAKSAEFRVRYDHQDDSGIPSKIEYRAKSFLRLVFEFDSTITQSAIPSVFPEENA